MNERLLFIENSQKGKQYVLVFPQLSKAHPGMGTAKAERRSTLGRMWLDSKTYREEVEQEELGESASVFGTAR
jgi:hypothetical protein